MTHGLKVQLFSFYQRRCDTPEGCPSDNGMESTNLPFGAVSIFLLVIRFCWASIPAWTARLAILRPAHAVRAVVAASWPPWPLLVAVVVVWGHEQARRTKFEALDPENIIATTGGPNIPQERRWKVFSFTRPLYFRSSQLQPWFGVRETTVTRTVLPSSFS